MKCHCYIEISKCYRFSKDILNIIIPINLNNIRGILYMPDNIDNIRDGVGDLFYNYFLKEKIYAGSEDSLYFHLKKFICEFNFDDDFSRCDIYDEIKRSLTIFFDLVECYSKKLVNNDLTLTSTNSKKFNFVLIEENEEEINCSNHHFDFIVNFTYNKNKCITKYTLLKLLLLAKYQAKPILEYQLLREARDILEIKNYRHVIINCCTICEIVFSKLLVDKLTKNGSNKEDVEKILNNINGIAALFKLLKEFGINTIKADFLNLAGLRNKAAHIGINPSYHDSIKYLKVCDDLLDYHKIIFYEIEK